MNKCDSLDIGRWSSPSLRLQMLLQVLGQPTLVVILAHWNTSETTWWLKAADCKLRTLPRQVFPPPISGTSQRWSLVWPPHPEDIAYQVAGWCLQGTMSNVHFPCIPFRKNFYILESRLLNLNFNNDVDIHLDSTRLECLPGDLCCDGRVVDISQPCGSPECRHLLFFCNIEYIIIYSFGSCSI